MAARMHPATEKGLFSSSPARPSHHRTQLPPKAPAESSGVGTRRSLKRTASAAALLTPPGSPEKDRHRSKKRTFTDSDDEDEVADEDAMELGSPESKSPPLDERIRRRVEKAAKAPGKFTRMLMKQKLEMSKKRVEREDSLAFLSARGAGAGPSTSTRGRQLKRGPTAIGEQVDRMRLDSDDYQPAAGQKRTLSPKAPKTPERPTTLRGGRPQPATPTRTSPRRKHPPGPIRDSPNNPFLRSSPRAPASSEPFEEKETMTYIFRGSKAIFRNPVYGGPSTDQSERARLPAAHPDFSPDLMTAPKLLWPSAVQNDSDAEPDADVGSSPIGPPRFTRASTSGRGRGANKKRRVAAPEGDVFGPSPDAMDQ